MERSVFYRTAITGKAVLGKQCGVRTCFSGNNYSTRKFGPINASSTFSGAASLQKAIFTVDNFYIAIRKFSI
jgi:hypothetical protein